MTQSSGQAIEGPRPMRTSEIGEVIDLLDKYIRVARGNPPSIGRDWAFIYCPANADNVMVMTEGGRVIATTGIWVNDIQVGAARLRVGGINCVLTEPEYRQHGLGMKVMNACHQRMIDLGCHLGLLGTRIPNWYRRLGWEFAGVARTFELNRGNISLLPDLPSGVTAEKAGLDMLDQIVKLREEFALGSIRTAEVFAAEMKARQFSEFFIARQSGRIAAYLLPGSTHIFEWAGPPQLVAALIRAWFQRVDDTTASTSTRKDERVPLSLERATLAAPPAQASPLTALLENLHFPGSHDYLGMIRLLDAQGVYQAFGRHDVRVKADGDKLSFSCGRASVTLDLCRAAKLVFGPEKVTQGAWILSPCPCVSGRWSMFKRPVIITLTPKS